MSNIKNPAKTQVLVFPAYHGDSIIVKTIDSDGNPFHMVIDGGTAKTYDDTLKRELKKIAFIDVMVLTHIDSDHIAGLIKFVKTPFSNLPKSENIGSILRISNFCAIVRILVLAKQKHLKSY